MSLPSFDLDIPSGEECLQEADDVPVEPSAKRPPDPRFRSRTLDDVTNLIEQRVPTSTKRTTTFWLSVFESFNQSRGETISLKEDSPAKICDALSLCYVNARTQKGQAYQRPSLMSLRAAIQRHLSSIRPGLNIISGPEFQQANAALDARLKEMKREGESKPAQHKAIISDQDMKKLAAYFADTNSPVDSVVLTESVWFAISYHCALRGCENQEYFTVYVLLAV